MYYKTIYKKSWTKIILLYFVQFFLLSCDDPLIYKDKESKMNKYVPPISEDVLLALHKITQYRFLFAHHSVGENILDGMREITKETGYDFQIAGIDIALSEDKINLAEFSPGKNRDPKSKIDSFTEQVKQLNNGFVPNVALLKFCFVDFTPDANMDELMAYYKEKLETLQKNNPKVIFAHCTVPLTIWPTDFKSRIKRLLGLQVWGDASNITRGRFNDLLYETFSQDPIFDIARIESTQLDGTRIQFTHKGREYYCLSPEYTNDDGHLNSLGRRIVASEFTVFLKNALETKKQ